MWHWKTEVQLDLHRVCFFGPLIQLSRPSAALLYVLARDLLLSPVRGGALTCFTQITMGLLRPPSNHPKYQRSVEPRSICYFGKVKTETLLHLAQPVLLQCRWSAASSQTRQFCFDHLRPAQLVRRNELHPSKPLILSWWWRKASGHTLKDYGARNMFNNSETKLRIG